MKTHPNKVLPLLFLMWAAVAGPALADVTVTDDFTRANTTTGLGANYTAPQGNAFVNNNTAYAQSAASDNVAIYNGLTLDTSFTISLQLGTQTTSNYAGIMFDYDAATNTGLLLRIKSGGTSSSNTSSWQFVYYNAGALTLLDHNTGSDAQTGTFTGYIENTASGTPTAYLTLSSTGTANQLSFSVGTTAGGSDLLAAKTIYTSGAGYASQTGISGIFGQAGFDLGQYSRADNLSITTVPEPSSWALLGAGAICLGCVVRRREWSA